MKAISISFMFTCFTLISVAQKKNNFEDWTTKPSSSAPAENNLPPSDAIILFGENTLNSWQYANGVKANWEVSGKVFSVSLNEPDIFTKQSFGNCQLHAEWKIPTGENHDNLNWGNSGLYFMGLNEVQIYDSYLDKHEIYYNRPEVFTNSTARS